MTRYLLVPGRGKPRPEHWMQRLADAHPDYQWAPYPPGPPFIIEDRIVALHEAISAGDEPAVLIAHSAGCRTAVVWAGLHTGPVRAALLVAPPYFDPNWTPGAGEIVYPPMPRERLPYEVMFCR